jgi:hypothetical protein
MTFAPTGWTLDATNGYEELDAANEVYLKFAGESVLEALIRIAETTGEHFIRSFEADRAVLWLGLDERDSGVVALAPPGPLLGDGPEGQVYITSLQETQTAYELVSRVYPWGGGSGATRGTLAQTTKSAPAGYTLNASAGYLSRDAAEAAYGRIDKRLDCPDVVPVNASGSQLSQAADTLFDRAYVHLARHSASSTDPTTGDVPRAYTIGLVGCKQALLPGYTLHVVYRSYYEGGTSIVIDRDLWILASTVQVSAEGVSTVQIEAATVDVAPLTDAELLARLIRQQRAMQAYAPGTG